MFFQVVISRKFIKDYFYCLTNQKCVQSFICILGECLLTRFSNILRFWIQNEEEGTQYHCRVLYSLLSCRKLVIFSQKLLHNKGVSMPITSEISLIFWYFRYLAGHCSVVGLRWCCAGVLIADQFTFLCCLISDNHLSLGMKMCFVLLSSISV